MKALTIILLVICFVFDTVPDVSASENQQTKQDTTFAGTYKLFSVNGNKVPATLSHDDVKFQVTSGSFIIKANGTCISKMNFIPPDAPAEVTREVKATFVKDGPKMMMQWEGAGQTTGTLEGNTFTMDNEGMVLVYKK